MRNFLKRGLTAVLAAAMLATSALAVDWPQFLGDPAAQGVSDGRSATVGSDLDLRWEKLTGTLGEDGVLTHTWNDVPGTPIVVGDYVYYYSSQYLRKVDLATGQEVKTAQVYGEPVNQFFIDIAYGEGKIFVPCQVNNMNDGTGVEGCFFRVFDADTLEQLYVTESIAKGQMQSPVMYHDGYFVTGTYGRNGVYAGFSAEDEDPTRPDEVKKAAWTVESGSKYGFSFNGAAFVGKYCYFGYGSTLYVVDYKTGDTRTYELGEGYANRSTIVYSTETNRLYVACNHPTEGASVFSFALDDTGMPVKETAKEWVSHTKGGGTQSSPVIYRGRLYIGGGGYTMGSNEPFHVVDANTMEEIYSVPILTKGSAGISTAYATAENNWQVYIYLVPYAPKDENVSQMWILKDSQGQTKADYEVVDGIGHRQYCSQSVIVAEDGSLLWYNDAARLYCYENVKALEPGVFRDTKNHWAKDKIALLAQKEILNGTGSGRFSPDAPVTRSQFVQMLAKLSGEDYSKCTSDAFSDVQAGAWYAPAVAWAVEKGIAAGTGSGRFDPDAEITRQDMAVMLMRYVENAAKTTLPENVAPVTFADNGDIAAYAAQAVAAMQRAGIISGIAAGSGYRFAPKDKANRAQAAAMVAGLYQALNGQD